VSEIPAQPSDRRCGHSLAKIVSRRTLCVNVAEVRPEIDHDLPTYASHEVGFFNRLLH
jgi:hypothetical protein